jgi:integrase
LDEISGTQPRLREDGTPDRRYSSDTIKIRPMLGELRNWEVDANRLDRHLKSTRAAGYTRKTEVHHLILSGIVQLGVKLGAMPIDPMSVVRKGGRRRRGKAKAMDEETRDGLQAQLKKWLAGENIPGTPAYTHGPKRDPDILRIADILLASGCRPYEGLAFRRCDVVKKPDKWQLIVCGTIKRKKGKQGLYRQNWTKTDAGYRIVLLPGWAVNTLKEMGADEWSEDDQAPLFPSRRGGWRDPHNTARTWRAARGSKYAWITSRTMRRTNLTAVAEEYGTEQASRQAGHAVISTGADITDRYIDRPRQAPDSTTALEKLR